MRFALIAAIASVLVACGGPASSPSVTNVTPAPTPTSVTSSVPTSVPTSGAVPLPSHPPNSGTLGPYNGTGVPVGTYFINEAGLRYTFTVPADGWWTNDYPDFLAIGKVQSKYGPMTRLFLLGGNLGGQVFTDACHWKLTGSTPGGTVDDLVAALAAVKGFESTAPSDSMVGGYAGKHLRLTVPADVNVANCDEGEYNGYPGFQDITPGRVQDFWVFDADGTRHVVWSAFDGNTPAAAQAELTELINSLEIAPARP